MLASDEMFSSEMSLVHVGAIHGSCRWATQQNLRTKRAKVVAASGTQEARSGSKDTRHIARKEGNMKNILMLFAVALALLVTAASAQTIQLKAEIPFGFIVNGATLPAGEYLVRSEGAGGAALLFSDLNGHRNNLMLTNACRSLKAATKTKLVFHRYGDRYFLSQIWIAGKDSGRELPTSRRETEVARDFSMQEVVLVARR
jgi:hypothetical protein